MFVPSISILFIDAIRLSFKYFISTFLEGKQFQKRFSHLNIGKILIIANKVLCTALRHFQKIRHFPYLFKMIYLHRNWHFCRNGFVYLFVVLFISKFQMTHFNFKVLIDRENLSINKNGANDASTNSDRILCCEWEKFT